MATPNLIANGLINKIYAAGDECADYRIDEVQLKLKEKFGNLYTGYSKIEYVNDDRNYPKIGFGEITLYSSVPGIDDIVIRIITTYTPGYYTGVSFNVEVIVYENGIEMNYEEYDDFTGEIYVNAAYEIDEIDDGISEEIDYTLSELDDEIQCNISQIEDVYKETLVGLKSTIFSNGEAIYSKIEYVNDDRNYPKIGFGELDLNASVPGIDDIVVKIITTYTPGYYTGVSFNVEVIVYENGIEMNYEEYDDFTSEIYDNASYEIDEIMMDLDGISEEISDTLSELDDEIQCNISQIEDVYKETLVGLKSTIFSNGEAIYSKIGE